MINSYQISIDLADFRHISLMLNLSLFGTPTDRASITCVLDLASVHNGICPSPIQVNALSWPRTVLSLHNRGGGLQIKIAAFPAIQRVPVEQMFAWRVLGEFFFGQLQRLQYVAQGAGNLSMRTGYGNTNNETNLLQLVPVFCRCFHYSKQGSPPPAEYSSESLINLPKSKSDIDLDMMRSTLIRGRDPFYEVGRREK
jgi:hypothetical protein